MSATIAIGFFDGVHLGHQKILAGADVAVTFKNHPATVLNPAKAPKLIMSFDDRIEAIKACGVQNVLALDFTPELASLTPEQFLQTLLRDLRESSVSSCSAEGPVLSFRCGANWRFGKNAAGDPKWLRNHGIPVEVIDAAVYDNSPVSSTRIRECLVRGEIAAANAMLGRGYKVRGEREKGKGEGKSLGYPTINLRLNLQSSVFNLQYSLVELPFGVYQVLVEGKKAIANYGFAPTFADRAWKEPVLEVHLLDGCSSCGRPTTVGRGLTPARASLRDSPLARGICAAPPGLDGRAREVTSSTGGDRDLEVEFVRFIRPERKFDSPEALKTQIAADIAALI